MNMLQESSLSLPIEQLRNQMREQGYLYVKSFFPSSQILKLAEVIFSVLQEEQWGRWEQGELIPCFPVHRICSEGFYRMLALLMQREVLHELASHQDLLNFLSLFLEQKAFAHPRKMIRVTYPYSMNPHDLVPPHQDFFYVKGDLDTFTCWVPLGHYPIGYGGLKIAPRSHLRGLMPTQMKDKNSGRFGCSAIQEAVQDVEWLHGHYDPGDLLLFHSLTLHASDPNEQSTFRLSIDMRCSSASGLLNEDELLPPYHTHLPPWSELTQGWIDPERFRIPPTLNLHPNALSSEELANTHSRFV